MVKRNITWGSDYSLLFIDNPVGVGFSYSESGEYATNIDEVKIFLFSFHHLLAYLLLPSPTSYPVRECFTLRLIRGLSTARVYTISTTGQLYGQINATLNN